MPRLVRGQSSPSIPAGGAEDVGKVDISASSTSVPVPKPPDPEPPSPRGLTDDQKAKLKASRHLSKRMPVMDLKARLSDQLKQKGEDASRGLGNLGIVAGHAGEKVGGLMSASAGAVADKVKFGSSTVADIQKQYGKEVDADLKQARKETKSEIESLEKKQSKGRLEVNEAGKLDRLKILQDSFEKEPMAIARAIHENRHDPAYQVMGPTHFAGMEAVTRKRLEAKGQGNYGMTTMERVCIYGYTTKDYTVLNPALRDAKGAPLTDPKLKAYADHINSGLAKLPDYAPAPGKDPLVYRGMMSDKLPQFVKDQIKPGGVLKDFAFVSTSVDRTAAASAGDIQLNIGGFAGKGGKLLPFSAFEGEGEVLFPPGTQFNLDKLAPYSQVRWEVGVS